jgi:3-oxoacyl-[acyl-carrier protein] reductase
VAAQQVEAEYYVTDIFDEDVDEQVVAKVKDRFGRVDVLINNAGIWHEGPTVEHPRERIARLFAVNTIGLIYVTQAVIPVMKSQRAGQIFNVVSVAGVEPSAEWGVYTATKYAVRGFTESLKQELQPDGIKVMGFYPGGMDTTLFENAGFDKGLGQPWMMKREEVADIIVFMLNQPDDIVMDHVEVRKFMGRPS